MRVLNVGDWVAYCSDDAKELEPNKCGKWMYFFQGKNFAQDICEKSINQNIVTQSKHSDAETGVSCFYLEIDDIETHKKVIRFFLDNNLIRRTKTGKLYDISFKLDNQTLNLEYGDDFKAELKLSELIDLVTEEWVV